MPDAGPINLCIRGCVMEDQTVGRYEQYGGHAIGACVVLELAAVHALPDYLLNERVDRVMPSVQTRPYGLHLGARAQRYRAPLLSS